MPDLHLTPTQRDLDTVRLRINVHAGRPVLGRLDEVAVKLRGEVQWFEQRHGDEAWALMFADTDRECAVQIRGDEPRTAWRYGERVDRQSDQQGSDA